MNEQVGRVSICEICLTVDYGLDGDYQVQGSLVQAVHKAISAGKGTVVWCANCGCYSYHPRNTGQVIVITDGNITFQDKEIE